MLSDPYGSAETPWMSVIAAKLRRLIYGDFFIYRNRMKIHKKDCLGKRQPSLKPVNLAGYRRRTAIWFKRINLKLQFPLLHIIPAGEDFYF